MKNFLSFLYSSLGRRGKEKLPFILLENFHPTIFYFHYTDFMIIINNFAEDSNEGDFEDIERDIFLRIKYLTKFQFINRDYNSKNLLAIIAYRGYLNLLKFFVIRDRGQKQNQYSDIDKEEAINAASAVGNLKIVKYLVSIGVNPTPENNFSYSRDSFSFRRKRITIFDAPLYTAAYHGQLEILKYLVSQGAKIHSYRNLALKLAEENNHITAANYLRSLIN